MTDSPRRIELDDAERNSLLAVWSQSGKRLIVSVAPKRRWDEAGQVQLDTHQAEQLRVFLTETLAPASGKDPAP